MRSVNWVRAACIVSLAACVSISVAACANGDESGKKATEEYTVYFIGGEDDVTGQAPPDKVYEAGEEFLLPQNTFTRDEYVFSGWSDGTQVYQEEASYLMPAHDIEFSAQWTAVEADGLPDQAEQVNAIRESALQIVSEENGESVTANWFVEYGEDALLITAETSDTQIAAGAALPYNDGIEIQLAPEYAGV